MPDWVAIHLDGKGGIERIVRVQHSSNMRKAQVHRMVTHLSTRADPRLVAVIPVDRLLDQLGKEGI